MCARIGWWFAFERFKINRIKLCVFHINYNIFVSLCNYHIDRVVCLVVGTV